VAEGAGRMTLEVDRYFRVVGWEDFQHYKDRDPPWVKLHRRLLDNYGWCRLRDISKGHLVGVWLLAARHDNKIVNDAKWVAQRIGASSPVDLGEMERLGFLEPWQPGGRVGKREDWPSRHIPKAIKAQVWDRDEGQCRVCAARRNIEYDHITPVSMGGSAEASNIQLLCRSCNRKKRNKMRTAERIATQSTEQHKKPRSLEAEAEAEAEAEHTAFEEAWALYPKRPNNSKASARRSWQARIKAGVPPVVMVEGARRYAAFVLAEKTEPKFIKMASTFFGPDEHYLSDYTTDDLERKIKTYTDESCTTFTPEFLRAVGAQAPR
jgi:hypothetical protein